MHSTYFGQQVLFLAAPSFMRMCSSKGAWLLYVIIRTLHQCLKMSMTQMRAVYCTGVIQCGPLQVSMLMLTLNVVAPP